MTQCQLLPRRTPEDPLSRPVRKQMTSLLYHCYVLLLLYVDMLSSLNGRMYLTESILCLISASADDVFGQFQVTVCFPLLPTFLRLDNRHIHHLQQIRTIPTLSRNSPSSHATLCFSFQIRCSFWDSDQLFCLVQSSFLQKL